MKNVSVKLSDLIKSTNFEKVVNETLDDRIIYKEGLEILEHSQLFLLIKGDVSIGFYSIDDLGDCVEAHAYIYKSYRRHSLEALRFIIDSQSKGIKTSVYGTHQHVINFLTKLGFTITDKLTNALVKNGKTYDVVELFYIKEKPNG